MRRLRFAADRDHSNSVLDCILLNLVLSIQAAYAAPIILMSQDRESQIDRQKLEYFYHVNLKSERELELLHHKLDELTALVKAK